MRKPVLAGNWKMNMSRDKIPNFVTQFRHNLGENGSAVLAKVDVMFAVPYLLIETAKQHSDRYPIRIGAQNVHYEASGAYTGEISIAMLKEINVDLVIIGHSERRQYFGETDESVARKVVVCLEKGLQPIACVGETKAEREANITIEVIKRQVHAILSPLKEAKNLIIAYEPVWAIGTGLTATSEQAQEVHALIRGLITEKFGKEVSDKMPILYGGSANPSNIQELLEQPDVDGGLVGGASLKPDDFAQMVTIAARDKVRRALS